MGQCFSAAQAAASTFVPQDGNQDLMLTRNDYELVIRASKDLEFILETYLGAQGKGLHEKCTSVQRLISPDLQRKIRYLATIRNKLVHERQFHHIPDRAKFLQNYQTAERDLQQVVAQHGRKPAGGQQGPDACRMM